MDKLKKIKIKQDDGTYSPEVPIGVDAENIDMSDGKTLPEVLGPINVDANGTIKHQFDELNKNKVDKDVYNIFTENINKKVDGNTSAIDEIANNEVRVELVEQTTKSTINKYIEDGTIANLTIEDNSIETIKYKDKSVTEEKIDENLINELRYIYDEEIYI